MIEINKSLHGANGKIKAVYLGTTPVVMYLGNQLLYDVDLDAEYVLMDIEDGDTIDGTIEAPVKSATLKGRTLINLINPTQNMEFSKSSAEAKEVYTINNISPRKLNVTVNTQPTYWYYIAVKINIDLLKPNTKYLIKAKNLNNIVSVQICEGSGNNKLAVQKPFMDNSYAIITTNDLSTLNGKEILYIVITDFKKNTIEYPTTISVEDIMLIEYQEGMENWDIPYFEVEGMQLVKMPVLTTIGKNLFDGKFKFGEIADGVNDIQTKNYVKSTSYISIKPNTNYFLSCSDGYNSTGGRVIAWYDSNRNFISHVNSKGVSPSNAYFARIRTRRDDSAAMTENEISTIQAQFEESSSATSYEPYKSNILTVNEPVELRGIGEVKDELNLMTGELIQNVNEIVLTGNANENWTKHEGLTNDEVTTFVWKVEELKATGNVLCDKLSKKKKWSDTEIGIWFDSNLIITISSSIATTVEQFRTYLNETPFTVYYQSSEKSIKTVDLTITDQDNKTISTINTFNDTTHFTVEGEEGKPQPTVSMEIACNPSQSVMALADQTEQLQQEQQELTEQIEQQERDTNILQTATTDLEEV